VVSVSSSTAARGTALLLASQISLSVSGYVVAVILARGLGPVSYGIYGIVYSVLLGAELIGRFGVPQALAKLIAEQPKGSTALEGTAVTLMTFVYLAIFAAFWLASPYLADLFQVDDGGRLFRIASLDIPFYGLFFTCGHVLMGRRMFSVEAVAGFLYAVTKVAGMSALLYIGISVAGALIVNVLGSAVALVFTSWWVGRASFRPTLSAWHPLLRLALPVGLFALGSQLLLSLDLWSLNAIGRQVTQEAKGWYVAATNLARIPSIVGFVLAGVLIPSISNAVAAGRGDRVTRSVRDTTRFLAITLLPGCALIAVEAQGMLELLFSEVYGDAAPLLQVLIFAQGLMYTGLITYCGILIACGLPGTAARITLVLLPIALGLNLILISTSGAMGAAIAALSVNFLGAVVAAGLVSRRVSSIMSLSAMARAVLAASLVAAAAAYVRAPGYFVIVEWVILGVGYLALAGLLGLLSLEDVKLFLSPRKGAALEGRPNPHVEDKSESA
jgi:stage V sporulation protein B